MKNILLVLTVLFFANQINAQCTTDRDRVLIIGDSWAAFSWEFDAHNIAFDKYGLTDQKAYSTGGIYSANGEHDLSQNGTKARNYLTPIKKNLIIQAFEDHPHINIVHLSESGNDFLGDWDTTWTQSQIDVLTTEVYDSLMSIVDFLRAQRPGVKVLLSGYSFPNFEESINDLIVPSQHPFYNRWIDMKKPTFLQMNTLMKNMHAVFDTIAMNHSDIYFVDNKALMQYHFGQTYNLPYAPGGTYPPLTAPMPAGFIDYPSPLAAMNDYLGIKDAFHLGPQGFEYFMGNQTKKFYFDALRDYDTTTRAIALGSGSINGNGDIADTLLIGSVNSVEHKGYLTFVTPNFDASQAFGKVSLFLKRKSLQGTMPSDFDISIGLTSSYFGDSIELEAIDYSQVFAGGPDASCEVGSLSADDYWLRLDIHPLYFSFVPNDTIQVQLNFSSADSDPTQAFEFYLNEGSGNQPILDYHYYSNVGIEEVVENTSELSLTPNPTNDFTTLNFEQPITGTLRVFNSLGALVKTDYISNNSAYILNVNDLNKGMYIIQIIGNNKHTFASKLIID